jgi:hypothetical protein
VATEINKAFFVVILTFPMSPCLLCQATAIASNCPLSFSNSGTPLAISLEGEIIIDMSEAWAFGAVQLDVI